MLLATVCGLLVLAVGVLDYVTGVQASVVVVYLLPIILGTWLLSRRAGIVLAVGCSVTWLVAERMEGVCYSHPLIQAWNAVGLLVSFLVVVSLLSALGESYARLEERVRGGLRSWRRRSRSARRPRRV